MFNTTCKQYIILVLCCLHEDLCTLFWLQNKMLVSLENKVCWVSLIFASVWIEGGFVCGILHMTTHFLEVSEVQLSLLVRYVSVH